MMDLAWTPSPDVLARSVTARFMGEHGISTYSELVSRSINERAWFWDAVVRFLGLPFSTPYSAVMDESRGKEWSTWFEGGRINLAAVCVDRWADQDPGRTALVWEKEAGGERGALTFGELRTTVARWSGCLQNLGVSRGRAVAVYLPMSPEAVIALLAVARIGAMFIPIFSGFGADAIAARLVDPKPALLICPDGFNRRGRLVESKEIADRAVEMAGGIDRLLVVPYTKRSTIPLAGGRDVLLEQELARAEEVEAFSTEAEAPVMIAYTSGTTGRPKGAVHVHGGVTVKLAEEGAFQLDAQPGDRLMWATDMGWIMGPWSVVAALANGAAVGTYDGAPDYPHPGRLWQVAEKLELTILGVSPTLIRSLQPHGTAAIDADLSRLRVLGSTGEPWNPDPWWWLFRDVGQKRIPIVNISGGTEVGACILSVNLLQGIKPTSLGGPSLGMAADVFDNEGRPVRGEVGELVIKESWPAVTRGFWGDPDRYLSTYWQRWPGVWAHGDWASIDDDGFWFLHGRSDDTLNIAGKRIGPAEIESAVVAHPQVTMAAAIGIPDRVKGEAAVVYAVTTPGSTAGDDLVDEIGRLVEAHLGRPFRPQRVLFVSDLPRTRSAKIMRRVVKALALGEEPGDLSSLENPRSLDEIVPIGD